MSGQTLYNHTVSASGGFSDKTKRNRNRMLHRAKARHLGLFEAFHMRFLGKRDGKHSLPKKSEDGTWMSPTLRKETDAYGEFCAIIWGRTQNELYSDHKTIEHLLGEIKEQEKELNDLIKNKPTKISEDKLKIRRKGEESLPEEIIRMRRQKNYNKENVEMFGKIKQLEISLGNLHGLLHEKQAKIQEVEHITRMACEKVYHHTKQRIDVYWGGVLFTHQKTEELPPAPTLLSESDVEAVYLATHQKSAEKAIQIIKQRKNINKTRNDDDTKDLNGKEQVQ